MGETHLALNSTLTLHSGFDAEAAAATLYLEDVRFEDVMPQFHRLLPVELPLLAGEHEGHESVSGPELETREKKRFAWWWRIHQGAERPERLLLPSSHLGINCTACARRH